MKKFIQTTHNYLHFRLLGAALFCMLFYIPSIAQNKRDTISYVQTVIIKTGKIDTVLIANGDYEAPNWRLDN